MLSCSLATFYILCTCLVNTDHIKLSSYHIRYFKNFSLKLVVINNRKMPYYAEIEKYWIVTIYNLIQKWNQFSEEYVLFHVRPFIFLRNVKPINSTPLGKSYNRVKYVRNFSFLPSIAASIIMLRVKTTYLALYTTTIMYPVSKYCWNFKFYSKRLLIVAISDKRTPQQMFVCLFVYLFFIDFNVSFKSLFKDQSYIIIYLCY